MSSAGGTGLDKRRSCPSSRDLLQRPSLSPQIAAKVDLGPREGRTRAVRRKFATNRRKMLQTKLLNFVPKSVNGSLTKSR